MLLICFKVHEYSDCMYDCMTTHHLHACYQRRPAEGTSVCVSVCKLNINTWLGWNLLSRLASNSWKDKSASAF